MVATFLQFSAVWSFSFCWLVFVDEIYLGEGITINVPLKHGYIGNQPLTLECEFSADGNEMIKEVKWLRKRKGEGEYTLLAVNKVGQSATIVTDKDTSLLQRLAAVSDSKSLNLMFKKVFCSDKAVYKCAVTYIKMADGADDEESDSIPLIIDATAQKPYQLTVEPNQKFFVEDTRVVFTCTGIIGRPPGKLSWFYVDSNHSEQRVLKWVVHRDPVLAGGDLSCTYQQSSTLTMVLGEKDNGASVRCKALQAGEETSEGCLQTCLQSNPLSVLSTSGYFSGPWYSPGAEGDYDVAAVAIVCVVLVIAAFMVWSAYVFYKKNEQAGDDSSVKYGEFDSPTSPIAQDLFSMFKLPTKPQPPPPIVQKDSNKFLRKDSNSETDDRAKIIRENGSSGKVCKYHGKRRHSDRRTSESSFENPEESLGKVWGGQI